MTIWNRLQYLWPARRRREEREMREELASLTAIAGSKELGNLTLAMEDVRSAWGWTAVFCSAHPSSWAQEMGRVDPENECR